MSILRVSQGNRRAVAEALDLPNVFRFASARKRMALRGSCLFRAGAGCLLGIYYSYELASAPHLVWISAIVLSVLIAAGVAPRLWAGALLVLLAPISALHQPAVADRD